MRRTSICLPSMQALESELRLFCACVNKNTFQKKTFIDSKGPVFSLFAVCLCVRSREAKKKAKKKKANGVGSGGAVFAWCGSRAASVVSSAAQMLQLHRPLLVGTLRLPTLVFRSAKQRAPCLSCVGFVLVFFFFFSSFFFSCSCFFFVRLFLLVYGTE